MSSKGVGLWRITDPASYHLSKDVQNALLERWREPHRKYHTLSHLQGTLNALFRLQGAGLDFNRRTVEQAVWFHDAIYVIGQSDNEERSAALALHMLPGTGPEVARLVRTTADHRPPEGDRDAAALCDADLAILGEYPHRYRAYVQAVREEYVAVPWQVYAPGRIQVLSDLLERDHIYSSEEGRRLWEKRARRNMSQEIAELEERWPAGS